MSNFFKSLIFFISSKKIHKAVDQQLAIKYSNEFIEHSFDRSKTYFLYIHIPFCNEFCTFCSFHKFKYEQMAGKEYFFHLRVELKKLKNLGIKFKTAYIGGGTPLIDEYELAKTIEFIKKEFDIDYVSCETTPNRIQKGTLQNFKGLISRLSIGVQSFNDDILKTTSRYYKYGSAKELQERIYDIKDIIPCTSIDLIFNFQNQTKEMLLQDLKIAKKLEVDQIVTYPLMTSKLKKATTLEHFKILKESKEYEFYKVIRDELSEYYMNNSWAFSKDIGQLGDEYVVDNSEYIGVGSGAFTYINNQLFVNAYDLQQYKYMVSNHYNANIAMTEEFGFRSKIDYNFLLQIFKGGLNIREFNEKLGVNVEKVLKLEIFALRTINAIEIKDNMIIPTQFGNFLALIMMREFYGGMDTVRSKLRESMPNFKTSYQNEMKVVA